MKKKLLLPLMLALYISSNSVQAEQKTATSKKVAPGPKAQPQTPVQKQQPPSIQETSAVQKKVTLPEELKLDPEPEETKSIDNNEDLPNRISSKLSTKPKFKNRKAFTIDYNTWYEVLKIKDKTNSTYSDSKTHYFGVGFYYDYTVYEEKYGYAISPGIVTGNAQAGTQGSGEYYERRIPWLGYRLGGRLFFRANNRIDIGPAFIAQYKTTKWPEETQYQVMPQVNPQYFIYLDTRWRISYPLELIQSFGVHTRQYALVWRLGINYTLN
ncbi:MAG: hypothetical protein HUU56_09170 [Bdellovibrionaceae bacterium]|nr:hypothetical protein [Pseudobdellovibrionaceae bacterium]